MAGQGSQSKIGLKVQSAAGTGAEPTTALPVKSANITAPKPLIFSETIGGNGMKDNAVAGDAESSGAIVQEYDGESSGNLVWYATGANGYTAAGAVTEGQITTAPGATAGSTGATIPSGDYIYSVAAIWTHDFTGVNVLMPDSAGNTAETVTLGEEVVLTWTDPTGLTFTDHTYKGTAVYRSDVDDALSTAKFIKYVDGTAATWTDTGADARDTNISPVANTSIYKHTFKGAAAASGQDRLKYFTAQISKNVTDDFRYIDNKASDLALAISDRASVIELTMNVIGGAESIEDGEYSASAPTIRRQSLGRDVALAIDGTKNCDIQGLTITLNNNLERLNTLCGVSISEGDREITGDMTLIFNDTDLASATINAEEIDVKLFIQGEPLVTSGAALTSGTHGVTAIPFQRYTKVDIPRAALGEYSAPLEGPGQIIASASFGALYDSVAATDMTITMYNTVAVYNGA
ncbi:MAG: hypothetical protein KC800_02970 [Candidatus Eremiobacteraeota bacterium]|nr:hypothetical protein [Candidatus Eremiobacteraeota bacterium]